jgi:hypothetical protein
VEDASTECRERSIVAASYFRTIWEQFGAGADIPVGMTTSFTDVISATLDTEGPSQLRVLSLLEMSPALTSNQCGNRFETFVAAITHTPSSLNVQLVLDAK